MKIKEVFRQLGVLLSPTPWVDEDEHPQPGLAWDMQAYAVAPSKFRFLCPKYPGYVLWIPFTRSNNGNVPIDLIELEVMNRQFRELLFNEKVNLVGENISPKWYKVISSCFKMKIEREPRELLETLAQLKGKDISLQLSFISGGRLGVKSFQVPFIGVLD